MISPLLLEVDSLLSNEVSYRPWGTGHSRCIHHCKDMQKTTKLIFWAIGYKQYVIANKYLFTRFLNGYIFAFVKSDASALCFASMFAPIRIYFSRPAVSQVVPASTLLIELASTVVATLIRTQVGGGIGNFNMFVQMQNNPKPYRIPLIN